MSCLTDLEPEAEPPVQAHSSPHKLPDAVCHRRGKQVGPPAASTACALPSPADELGSELFKAYSNTLAAVLQQHVSAFGFRFLASSHTYPPKRPAAVCPHFIPKHFTSLLHCQPEHTNAPISAIFQPSNLPPELLLKTKRALKVAAYKCTSEPWTRLHAKKCSALTVNRASSLFLSLIHI